MLSYAARDMGGAGWAFGLHEALDSAGAVAGPLIVALALFLHGGYRNAFGLGAHRSLFRAAVAERIPRERRATALGAFNAPYGMAWFSGSVLLEVLYDRSPLYTVIAALVLQLAACPLLWHLRRRPRTT